MAFNIVEAQITRQQADNLVTNQIFTSSLGNVDIYAFPEMVTSSERIDLADGTSIAVPYHSCYAYFIDLMPFANWSHPCKYCFVNANGSHSMVDAEMAPEEENLSAISLMQRPVCTPNYTIPENAHGNSFESGDMSHKWAVLICGNANSSDDLELERFWFDLSSVYTVLTNVYHYQEPVPDELVDFTNRRIFVTAPVSISKMFCIENEYYSSQLNTTSIPFSESTYPGDFINRTGHDEDLLNHSKENIENLFRCFVDRNLCAEYNESGYGFRPLTEDDELFIYITGHGSSDGDNCYFSIQGNSDNKISDEELIGWLRGIECSQITLVMQNCNSGGFIDKFLNDINNENCRCKNRIGFSAASADGVSWIDKYRVHNINGRSANPEVNEFTYYWTAAALGYYPIYKLNDDGNLVDIGPWTPSGRNIGDGTMNWTDYFHEEEDIKPHSNYEGNPDTDHDEILSLKELFNFANNLDSWSWNGYYCPIDDTLTADFQPEFPQFAYESTFTAEAATLRGYEGQVDGTGVNSGTATQPYRLCGDLWVGPDSDLTMWDDIYSPEDVKIYIEPTGMLTMDGCTFDKLPETDRGMWQGVQVWGNFNENQMPEHGKYKQGVLVMKNDATIKNSRCAVELWHSGDWNSMGGIIHATNAHFINNTKAIHALNYRNMVNGNECDYLAQFRNCEFSVGDGYIGSPDALFYKHVDLANVRGVKFYGCDFGLKCVNANISDWTEGIAAYNAGFTVSGYTQGATHKPSTFDGFFNGVQALDDGSDTYSFSVKNSTFTNNDYGIFARAADVPVILNNTFSIGLDNWYSCSAAIQLEGIGSFVVEGNSITKAPDCTNDNFGIIIKDSQTEESQVHLNDLDGLYCGNLAWGDNRGNNNDLGLEYYCNSNADNAFDFYVKYENPGTDIQQDQGNIDFDPHNTFSNGNNLLSNFYNQGEHEVYYHEYVNGSYNLDTYRVLFKKSNNLFDCQPHYGSGGNAHNGSSTPVLSTAQKQQCQTDYANALNTYNSVKNVYDRLTDGGSTNSTVADIRSAMPSDMWELRSKLLGSSPYLSEEVLKETADRDDVFTESILFEILASNPDELRKGDIIKYVEDKEHPLPEYMVDILRQLSTGTTTNKTLLLNSMASSRHDYRQAAADMVRSILADSIVDMAELRGWLANLNDLSADRQIISTYMAEGDFGTAFSLANMLPALYEFDETALAEHDDYMELLGL